MTHHVEQSPSIAEICEGVKRLGYGVSQSVRLYGEEFEVMSDPFPEAGGIAVNVRTKKERGNSCGATASHGASEHKTAAYPA